MTRYPSSQVVTVSQLKTNDVMHCGQLSGVCVEWKCLKIVDGRIAIVDVAGSRVRMTSSDIRSGLPMFYANQCPLCASKAGAPTMKSAVREEITRYVARELEAADVSSALSRVDNYRRGGAASGGAGISSQKRYFRKKTADLTAAIMAASRREKRTM